MTCFFLKVTNDLSDLVCDNVVYWCLFCLL